MFPFTYTRADTAPEAIRAAAGPSVPPTAAPAQFIAGGTQMLDLMKLGTLAPEQLVDINGLALSGIDASPQGLILGALTRMSEVERHPVIRPDYPVLAGPMALAASQQIRNMASLAGNVLQR